TWLPALGLGGEIIEGWEARPHSRPYMAFVKIEIEGKGEIRCGGFLIWEDVVVLHLHPLVFHSKISMLLGAHNTEIDEPGMQKILVYRQIPQPELNDASLENDLMLLQLREKAKLTQTVGTMSLSQKKVKKGAVWSVAGWGQTSIKTNKKPSTTLQEVELMVMDKSMCLSRPYLHYVPSRMLCVGGPQETKGDSGGPLVCDGKAQGIVSHGSGDGSTPSVFTRLSKYVFWIKKTLHCPDYEN
uniref:Peptidase S1 domain-containing protein n=1 Tax=Terrapene triunguis TaxID=2587831 RepID=A0A674INT3_9SAUR